MGHWYVWTRVDSPPKNVIQYKKSDEIDIYTGNVLSCLLLDGSCPLLYNINKGNGNGVKFINFFIGI